MQRELILCQFSLFCFISRKEESKEVYKIHFYYRLNRTENYLFNPKSYCFRMGLDYTTGDV